MAEPDKLRCLFISSRPFTHSANLFGDLGKALEKSNIEVDYLWKRHKSVQFQSSTPISSNWVSSFFRKIVGKKGGPFSKILIRKKYKGKPPVTNNDITIQYHDEANPVVPPGELLEKINKDYDFILTGFWQDMINSSFLKAVYDKFKAPVLILSVDMAPITGGCYYFGSCRNFERGCGMCPALNLGIKNDQSAENYLIKKDNYKNAKIAFLGNTWMNQYARRSKLFPENRIFHYELQLDPSVFVKKNKKEARAQFNLPPDSFVIMLRSSDIVRKGNPDQREAVSRFLGNLQKEEKEKVVVVTVGDDTFANSVSPQECMVKNFGMVNKTELINLYNAASVFLCASLDDAGPSMINQAIMCGTPVVTYDSGTAMDVVIDGKSGYKAPKGDPEGLASGILKIFRSDKGEYSRLCDESRHVALEHNSLEKFPSLIRSILREI